MSASTLETVELVSGGITTCLPDESTSAEGLIIRADDALYNAKSTGRNRFFSYEMQMDTAEQRRAVVPSAGPVSPPPATPT